MLNKKAVVWGVMIGLIVMVVVAISLFRATTLTAGILTGGAEHQVCFLAASAGHISKVGPKSVVGLDICQRRIVHVLLRSGDILEQERKDEKEGIKKDKTYEYIYKDIPGDLRKNLAKWYDEPETNFDIKNSEGGVLRYRLNEVMANELKSCWGDLGRGTYNLFDEDFTNLKHNADFKSTDSLLVKLGKALQVWEIDIKENPKVCKVCSIILFDGAVQNKMVDEIDLKPFLKNNPVVSATREPMSYYVFLKDDIRTEGKASDYLRPEYTYTTKRTQAVVFMRVNLKSYFGKTISKLRTMDLGEIFSDHDYIEDGEILAMDFPMLMPFDEVKNNCDAYA